MKASRLLLAVLTVGAAALVPGTTLAAKHHSGGGKSASVAKHARKEGAGHGGTKRKKDEPVAVKHRPDAGRSEESEVNRLWDSYNVEPELPEQ